MTTGPAIGVVVMAYGTPRRIDDIAAYYTDIRRGRPPSPAQIAELAGRYAAIGGLSPLLERTEAQRRAIEAALGVRAPGQYTVALGMRHTDPSIEEAVTEVASRGVTRVVALVLAPHYSTMSVAVYLERATAAADAAGVELRAVPRWGLLAPFVARLASDVRARIATMPPNTKVIFTAHSLPERILAVDDPYPREVRATASAVASAAGLGHWSRWTSAWQSAGRTAETWIGPDVLDVIDDLAAAENADGVLVCPCGFVADHLEVLYDLDVAARQRAEDAGLVFDRTASVNDDPAVAAGLADLIVAAGG
jgi:protoporphyrin/coproporphyrin ferrochelatase